MAGASPLHVVTVLDSGSGLSSHLAEISPALVSSPQQPEQASKRLLEPDPALGLLFIFDRHQALLWKCLSLALEVLGVGRGRPLAPTPILPAGFLEEQALATLLAVGPCHLLSLPGDRPVLPTSSSCEPGHGPY